VLAYLFWHQPRDPDAGTAYEEALTAFHRSLARSLPVGTLASATFRVAELPWLSRSGEPELAYEDWYLVEDFAALGVLNEAAVGRGHVSAHDEAARRAGPGTAGVYALIEGEPCAQALGEASLAVWIARPAGSTQRGLGELLGDGMDPAHASLWRRQMNLGPAPEFCLLAGESPSGVGAERLPSGWVANVLEREALWSG
jgi:hypothetical protein